jgi:methionyl-tRNA formyltransferase
MRIIFLGSPKEVLAPLDALLKLQEQKIHEVVAVVSQPAKPVGRKNVLTDPPLAQYAKSLGLTVLQPDKVSSPEALAALRELKPDLCLTAAYGQILSDAFLQIPTRGTINIHPSLLPRYRGAIPVPAALLDGLTETGVTILFTVKQLDAGAIILQRKEPIRADDTTESLTERLFVLAGTMLPEALELLEDRSFAGVPQDPAQVTHCRKIDKEDGLVVWSKSAQEISNALRAYYPWPGSFSFTHKGRVTLLQASSPLDHGAAGLVEPGEFVFDKKRGGILVKCGEGALLLTKFKPAGGKEVDARSFWNGLNTEKGKFYHEQQ